MWILTDDEDLINLAHVVKFKVMDDALVAEGHLFDEPVVVTKREGSNPYLAFSGIKAMLFTDRPGVFDVNTLIEMGKTWLSGQSSTKPHPVQST